MSDEEISNKLANTKIEEEEEDTFNFDMKKKKKSKKIDLDALEEAADGAGNGSGDDEDMLADMMKMKKKKKSKAKTVRIEEEGEDEDEEEDLLDMSAIKKKKKKSKKSLAAFEAELGDEESEEQSAPVDRAGEPWIGTDRDYTYPELLGRFYKILRENNLEATGEKRKYTIVPPIVAPASGKRTAFANIEDISRRMHRPPDHVIRYIYAELGTTGSVDKEQQLLIKGKFKQKQIENVLSHYIAEYVVCKTCKSSDTSMTKDKSLSFIKCETCGSTRTVAAINKGFQAATKAARRAERAGT
ncbi:translation initiation factor eIF-2 beta subunit [Coemansia sp. RSA 989]|nr:translation initiation factor eIF-2 beta subunit [Coemansia sp. RSA 989]